MDNQVLDANFVLNVESQDTLNEARRIFNNHEFELIERIRNNYYELKKKRNDPDVYLRGIIEKLDIEKDRLFISHGNDVVLYRPKKSIIVVPVQEDNLKSEAANAQYFCLVRMIKHLNDQLSANKSITKLRSREHDFGTILSSKKVKKHRISVGRGFELKYDNVNLEAVHQRLIDDHFIDDTTDPDVFRQIFSGNLITNKVIWYNPNSLRFFIRAIVDKRSLKKENPEQERGVKHPPEGIWQRTTGCFRSPDRDYEEEEFKDTKDPIARVTRLLIPAINLINNPR
jgi:hypothetical protein